jgi:MFS family permease
VSQGENEFRHGWRALLAAATGNGGGLGAMPIYSLSSFIAPLGMAFGWSRGAIGAAATIVTAGIFVTGPIVGHFCDKYGVRRLALPSIVLFAIAFAAMTMIGGSILTLYAGFALLALFGAATTSVAYTRVVNTWFIRSRGLALGITMTGSGLTAFAMPLLLRPIIAAHGWQAGFLTCAAVALIPLPFCWLLLHDRGHDPAAPPAVARGLLPGAVLRTRQFWTMVAAAIIFSSTMGGIIVHIVPVLTDLGLSPAIAARDASLLGIGMIVGRLATGTLLDRMNGPLLGLLLMTSTACGFLILYLHWMPAVPFAIIVIGLALGSEGDVLAFFTSRYFGMRSYAELFGWMFGFLALGTATGPLLIAFLQDGSGYRTALAIFAAQCLVSGLLLASLGRYPDWNATQGE